MQNAPSLTAKTAALLRAAHQLMEGGTIYPDSLAVSILGEDLDVISGFVRKHPELDRLRLFIVARSRFAEDCIAGAVAAQTRVVPQTGAAATDAYAQAFLKQDRGLWRLSPIGGSLLCRTTP